MGRATGFNQVLVWRTAAVALVIGALLLIDGRSALAQEAQPTDAQRITRLRDQAASQSDTRPDQLKPAGQGEPAKDAGKSAGSAAEEESDRQEKEKPLPPNERLLLGQGEGDLYKAGSGDSAKPGKLGGNWLLSTLAALGIVIALVFALRWMLRRGGIVTSAAPQGAVVEVLSRTTVAPRSHVVLMRIGHRILIVNDSTNGMRTLATVQDPEEVAELLGAIDASRSSSMSRSFSNVMGKLSNGWSSSEAELDGIEPGDSLDDGVTIDQTRGAVSSVRGRLAALAGGGIKA